MSNWWRNHWRRIVLQLSLWLLLAATVGLAMLVTYEKRRSLRVPLGVVQAVGKLRLRLPADWNLKSTAPGPQGSDCVEAEEVTPAGEPPRKLSIERLHVDGMVCPLEYLFRRGIFQEKDFAGMAAREKPTVSSIRVAGYLGTLITETFPVASLRGPLKKQLVACAMLPSAEALVIKLDGSGEADAADEELVRELAETVAVANVDPPQAGGGVIFLADGISVDVPRNFRALPSDDPNCISRQLVCDDTGNAWATVELISCLFFPGDGGETLRTMLLARDGTWICDAPRQTGPRSWQVERSDKGPFPGRAYLLTNGENQAILAVFRGGFHDASRFDAAWTTMATGIRFTGHPDCAAMLQCGAEQARMLATKHLSQLLAPASAQQWSRWDQSENLDKSVWMRLKWQSSQGSESLAQWQGQQDQRLGDGWGKDLLHRLILNWTARDDMAEYSMQMVNSPSESAVFPDSFRDDLWAFPDHAVTLRDGHLRSDAPRTSAAPAVPPAQYIPGGPLPLLLGKLELSGRTALIRTDCFLGHEGPLPGLLTLIVANTTDTQVKPDESGQAMACVLVRVNGSGRLSRWYYANGVLRYIDFAAGLRANQADTPGPQ